MKMKALGGLTVVSMAIGMALSFSATADAATDRLVVKDGGGTIQFCVQDDGAVGIGITPPVSKLHVSSIESAVDTQGVHFDYQSSALSGYNNIGLYSEATDTSTADSTSEVYALQGKARTGYGSTTNHKSIYGLRFTAQHQGTGLLTSAYGVHAYPYNGSTGTITNAYGLYTRPWMASGTITNWYGAYIGTTNLGTGTITNLYGIYVAEPSATNYFAGVVQAQSFQQISSRESKENIHEVSASEAIEAINQLKPVNFNYKTDAVEKHVGFIAEDVPEIVANKDRKNLSAMDIVAVLTKVVQEQQKTIAELKDKMASLETDLQMKKDKDQNLASLTLQ